MVANVIEYLPALRGQFLGLPGLRRRGAAIVDRRRHLAEDRGLIGSEGGEARIGVAAVAGIALHGNGGQQAAFGDMDGGRGDVDVEAGGDHGGRGPLGEGGGLLAAGGPRAGGGVWWAR